MADKTISTKIKLDGEAAFKSAMTDINAALKASSAELKYAEAAFRGNANSQEALTAKSAALSNQIDDQKAKVSALQAILGEAAAAYGEDSAEADRYRAQLLGAQTGLVKMEQEQAKVNGYLEEAESSADGCATSIDGYGKAAGDAAGKTSTLGDMIKAKLASEAIVGGLKALGSAVKGVADFIGGSVSEVASAGDAIDKQSQKIGVSAESYQKLSFAAEHSGVAMSAIEGMAKKLQATDFSGNIEDAILQLSAIEDPAERSAAATAMFGNSAAELAPLLNAGADGIQDMYSQLEHIGGVMSNDAVAAAAAYGDSLTNLQTAFGGLKNTAAGAFLPALSTVMDGMTMILSGDVDEGIAVIEEGLAQFAEIAAELGPIAMDAIQELLDAVLEHAPELIGMGAELIVNLIDGITSIAPQLGPIAADLIVTLVSALLQNAPALVSAAIQLALGLAQGLLQGLPQIVALMPQMIVGIVNAVLAGVSQLVDAGRMLVEGIWQGISAAKAWIKAKITSWVGDVIAWMKASFGIGSGGGGGASGGAAASAATAQSVGRLLPKNLALGWAAAMPQFFDMVDRSMDQLNAHITAPDIAASFSSTFRTAGGSGYRGASAESDADRIIAAIDGLREAGTIRLEDPSKLFRLIRAESRKNQLATGGAF